MSLLSSLFSPTRPPESIPLRPSLQRHERALSSMLTPCAERSARNWSAASQS